MIEKKVLNPEVDVIQRARGFWEKYSKIIIYTGIAVILIAGGWLVYKYMVKAPKEQRRMILFMQHRQPLVNLVMLLLIH